MLKNLLQLGSRAEDFVWASGIEDTFVPQTRPHHRALDEYQLIGHYQHWREDLALGRELGLNAIRWGVPWYRVEPLPGEFDWRWTDQVIPYLVEELGITPIIDLMHYGCPYWLYREFANPEYPTAVAKYARAFAQRYGHLIKYYTPLNEPHINAVWCGQRGMWPPYLRGEKGYIHMILQLSKGIVKTVEALKAVDPDAVMVHVEATGISRSGHPDFEAKAANEQARGFLTYDLITGRITPDHGLYNWLTQNQVDAKTLAAIADQPISLDIVGLNFYPQWSTREFNIDEKGRPVYKVVDKAGSGFTRLIQSYYERYQSPIMITETSARGSSKVRAQWLDASLAAVKDLRGRGVPVLGYTWFPMLTMIDWRYRLGHAPVDEYRLELGFYQLGKGENDPRWRPTALIEHWQQHRQSPLEAVGDLSGWDPGKLSSPT
jgi:beta-glucosidase